MRNGTRGPGAAIALTLLTACAGRGHQYRDGNMDFGSLKTVAVLPFQNLSRENVAAERVRDVFMGMLLATGAVYVLPQGEVVRGITRVNVGNATAPNSEEIKKLGGLLGADAVIAGVVKEYGEVRSASSAANVVSVTVDMYETATGKIVWSASSTKGGISLGDRMFGGGGSPMNDVTEQVVDDLLGKLFK